MRQSIADEDLPNGPGREADELGNLLETQWRPKSIHRCLLFVVHRFSLCGHWCGQCLGLLYPRHIRKNANETQRFRSLEKSD